MKTSELKNWKLKEVINDVEIVQVGASLFIEEKLKELQIQPHYNNHTHRGESFINWVEMPEYYKFFFDEEGKEDFIKELLAKSRLIECQKIMITYLQEDVVVKIPLDIFLNDWEGFIRSTLYNGLIASDDSILIMEVTRDYYLHSNFEIMPMSKATI